MFYEQSDDDSQETFFNDSGSLADLDDDFADDEEYDEENEFMDEDESSEDDVSGDDGDEFEEDSEE